MKNYFQLQYKMLNRHFIDFGLLPIVAYFICIAVFVYVSNLLFAKPKYAVYVYSFVGLSLLFKLSEKCRNDFLKLSFTAKKYTSLRVAENLLAIMPFVLFLAYKKLFLFALILAVLAVLLSFIQHAIGLNFTIPTPFKNKPFEFPEGFRKCFLLFPLAYVFAIIGIKVDNFNLTMFSLLMIFGIISTFYTKVETSYYVWLYNKSSKEFLYSKIKTAIKYVTLLSLPLLIISEIFFVEKTIIIIAFQLIGYVYLIQFVLAKYSMFPNQIGFPKGFIFLLTITFPPFVFVAIWYFYKEATKRLKTILYD